MARVIRTPEKFLGPCRVYAYILDALCADEEHRQVPDGERQWRWTPAHLAKFVRALLDDSRAEGSTYRHG